MIQTDPSYSYVDAWKRNLIPKQAGDHWRDRAEDGTWLKSLDHPAAWMEYYQSVTGRDPVKDGVDVKQYGRLINGQPTYREAINNPAVHAQFKRAGIDPRLWLVHLVVSDRALLRSGYYGL
jgi:hypothetical protein